MKRIKNKGFTLIELLGVIIILIAMLSLVIPKVINRVKSKDKENVIATLNSDILSAAARIYVDNHKKDYPEDEGSTYCTTIDSEVLNQIKKYMGTSLKDYNGNELNIVNKTIKVDYSNGYNVSIVDSNSCQPVYTNKDNCIGDNCKACYISKTYNNGVYKFEGKIINNSNKDGNLTLISDDIVGYTNDDGCTLKTLESAANEYVNNKVKKFKKINGNEYCLSIKELIENGYLDGPIIYSGQDITNTNSYKVKYNKTTGKYSYELSDSCQENLTCGTWIDLASNLTPVKYDSTINEWVITTEDDPYWYDYNNQEWANAVILTENAKNTLNVGDVVEVDTEKNKYGTNVKNTIDSIDALAMFVWIPRFSYTIKRTPKQASGYYYGDFNLVENSPVVNSSNIGAINIKCLSKDAPKETGLGYYYDGNPVSGWYTVPAFTFGTDELNGIWMSKFISSSTENNYKIEMNCTDTNCTAADKIRVLPNRMLVSGSNLTYNNIFTGSRSLSRSEGLYRVDNSKEDIHLIRNSEFASIFYLTNSIYGKYGNSNYTGDNKYVTASAISSLGSYSGRHCGNLGRNCSSSLSKSISYDDVNYGGYGSTTGNVTGIYDNISTGHNVYLMMAAKYQQSGVNDKYYDIFTTKKVDDYPGHALERDISLVGMTFFSPYNGSGSILERELYSILGLGYSVGVTSDYSPNKFRVCMVVTG